MVLEGEEYVTKSHSTKVSNIRRTKILITRFSNMKFYNYSGINNFTETGEVKPN